LIEFQGGYEGRLSDCWSALRWPI